jgi:hypothetical protein
MLALMETSPASHHAVIMIVIMTVMLARVLVTRQNSPVPDYREFHQIEESVVARQSWEEHERTVRKDWSGFAKRCKAATRTVCKLMPT